MKKLLLNKNNENLKHHIVNRQVCLLIYKDDFSGFITPEGDVFLGTCCNCTNKLCANYSIEELSTDNFKDFPKNPTKKVCPVQAISFDTSGKAIIDETLCIMCGLCIYRCPFAAIQYSVKRNKCYINTSFDTNYNVANEYEQQEQERKLSKLPKHIRFDEIPELFNEQYLQNIKSSIKRNSDLSEIIVRNTLLNLGYICNTNAQGNVHMRIEFFAENNNRFIIGESEISKNSQDTLSVIRRILDDVAVLVNRYGYSKSNVLPMAVLEVLPNKRTDYYEVISDINKILKIKIYTITYHILFVLHLLQVELSEDVLSCFYVDKNNTSLLGSIRCIIENIEDIDRSIKSSHYMAIK